MRRDYTTRPCRCCENQKPPSIRTSEGGLGFCLALELVERLAILLQRVLKPTLRHHCIAEQPVSAGVDHLPATDVLIQVADHGIQPLSSADERLVAVERALLVARRHQLARLGDALTGWRGSSGRRGGGCRRRRWRQEASPWARRGSGWWRRPLSFWSWNRRLQERLQVRINRLSRRVQPAKGFFPHWLDGGWRWRSSRRRRDRRSRSFFLALQPIG